MKRVLFVCTGNTCRSPMAEYCLRDMLAKRGLTQEQVLVTSAGLAATDGLPPAPEAISVMEEMGIDISHHRSRLLLPEMVAEADGIYVMTRQQEEVLRAACPGQKEKIHMLDGGIADPFGRPKGVYQACRDRLHIAVRPIATRLYQTIFNVGY